MTENQLTAETRAQIASKAQAEAHKELRAGDPEGYKDAYQRAKERLTAEALAQRA